MMKNELKKDVFQRVMKLTALGVVLQSGCVSCVQQRGNDFETTSLETENMLMYAQQKPSSAELNRVITVIGKSPSNGYIAFDTDGNYQTVEAYSLLDMTHPIERRVFRALRLGDRMRVADYRDLYKEIRDSYTYTYTR